MKVIVSSCLLGEAVRYDGSHKYSNTIAELLSGHEIIRICPETHGGLPVPRTPSEIKNNHVFDKNSNDVTEFYISGINIDLTDIDGADLAILKSKSPACGYLKIYDGSFSSKLIDGNGLFAEELIKRNIRIFTENDTDELTEILGHS